MLTFAAEIVAGDKSWREQRHKMSPATIHGTATIYAVTAGLNVETGYLSRHFIAEISLNVTLNHSQQTNHHLKLA